MAYVRIKICGITSESDALAAAKLGADAIGLNFYADSPRCLSVERAVEIVRALPPFIEPVALFVNDSFERMTTTVGRLGAVRTIQYHKDVLTPCPHSLFQFIPALPVHECDSLDFITRFIESCRDYGQLPPAILVDAYVPGLYGGTGRTATWRLLADFDPGVPMILAGGLTPDNVADAVKIVKPYGIDVASGVESSPGKKDPDKMRHFIDNARAAG